MKTKKLMVGGCASGKRPYSTRRLARAAAGTLTGKVGHRLRAYRCPLCDSYHLTKNRPRDWKAGAS